MADPIQHPYVQSPTGGLDPVGFSVQGRRVDNIPTTQRMTRDQDDDSVPINEAFHSQVEDFDKWNTQQFASFLNKSGLGEYSEMFIAHKISGRVAPLLTDENLREMGVKVIGDRLRIMAVVHALGHKARYNRRAHVWWEGTEQLYFSEMGRLFWTCGGFFPEDPSTYRLTSNHMKVKNVHPARIGPIKLCCCYSYSINNVDLSKVNDVDVLGEPAPCLQRVLCCAPGRDHIEILAPAEEDGLVTMILPEGDGERVCAMILQQIEEAQMLERK